MELVDITLNDFFQNRQQRDSDQIVLSNLERFMLNLNEMETYGIKEKPTLELYINFYKNRIEEYKKAIYNVEKNMRHFALCVLFNDKKHVYINRRINPEKDYHNYYQVAGGKLNNGESYEDCAKREAEEEAGVKVESIMFVSFDEYIDKKTSKLFKCAIFIGYIGEQVPVNKEPTNHEDWFSADLKEFKTHKLTDSLPRHYGSIKLAISEFKTSSSSSKVLSNIKKKKVSSNSKKRKVEESDSVQVVKLEEVGEGTLLSQLDKIEGIDEYVKRENDEANISQLEKELLDSINQISS